jgi:perosamine synthetase
MKAISQPLPAPVRSSTAEAVVAVVRRVTGVGKAALHEPEFAGREWEYVKECIDTGWVSSVGKMVDRFEAMLAEITGAARVAATVNGTAALHAAVILAGAGRDDEVIIPSFTFIATANAVSYAGAIPHLADIDAGTIGLDAAKLDAHLGDVARVEAGVCVNRVTGRPIKAAIVMHAFGHPADLDALAEVCARWKLVLIEDAAESLGSYYRGKHTGALTRIGALSFNGNKVVTTGGGGAVLTRDAALGARAKHLTTTARLSAGWNFVHDEVGYNYRLPNINAALGCAQLERLPDFIARKRKVAERYRDSFGGVEGAAFVGEPPETKSNYWLCNILLDRDRASEQTAVLTALNGAGFGARPAWTPMHMLPMYRACPRADLSVTEDIFRRLVSLPSSPALAGRG